MGRESPKKRGPDGGIATMDFKLLTIPYESFVRIKQINAETFENTCSHLANCTNKTKEPDSTTDCRKWTMRRVRRVIFKIMVMI